MKVPEEATWGKILRRKSFLSMNKDDRECEKERIVFACECTWLSINCWHVYLHISVLDLIGVHVYVYVFSMYMYMYTNVYT